MPKFCVKIYAAAIATADGIASISVPQTSKLVAINWAYTLVNAGATGSSAIYQLSVQSTRQVASNDVRNIIDECAAASPGGAGVIDGGNKYAMLPGVSFQAGDKIYLHLQTITAPSGATVNINLFFA